MHVDLDILYHESYMTLLYPILLDYTFREWFALFVAQGVPLRSPLQQRNAPPMPCGIAPRDSRNG